MSWILACLFFVWLGWLIGWMHAHYTVADERRKLGSFYVGKSVFKCQEIVEVERQ